MRVLQSMDTCLEMKIKDKLQIPLISDDELVVVVIGGPSLGESVLLHYGDGKWLIVDSCTSDGQNLPLVFLEKVGADLNKVGFVICSHWHDDHTSGMDTLLDACRNAYFMIPSVTNKSVLPKYFEYRINSTDKEKEKEAWLVFKRCLDVIDNRKNVGNPNLKEPQYIKEGYSFFDYPTHGVSVTVKALSPSNEMMTRFGQMLSNGDAANGRFNDSDIDQNMCSISLGVSFAGNHLFLGADLECNRPDEEDEDSCTDKCDARFSIGMCNVISNRFFREMSPYCYTKLNHHSSVTGYCPKYWAEHIADHRLAVSTVFTPQGLPRRNMVEKYLAKNSVYYITSRYSQKKLKKSDIKKVMGDSKYITSMKHISSAPGMVLTRYDLATGALKITETYLNAFQMKKGDLKFFEEK